MLGYQQIQTKKMLEFNNQIKEMKEKIDDIESHVEFHLFH